MAITTGRRENALSKLGGGIGWFKEVTQAGADIDTAFTVFPFIKDSQLQDDTKTDEEADEAGVVHYADADQKVGYDLTFLQRDVDTLQLFNSMRNKFYSLVFEKSASQINGLFEYLFLPIVRIYPKMDYKQPGNTVGTKFGVLKVPSTITLAVVSGITPIRVATLTPGDFSVTTTTNLGYYRWITYAS